MHTNRQYRLPANLFMALANERRLFLLWQLSQRPQTGQELAFQLNIRPTAVSRHLHILLRAGFVEGQRRGKDVIFSVRDFPFFQHLFQLAVSKQ